jgi:hypothetical protein
MVTSDRLATIVPFPARRPCSGAHSWLARAMKRKRLEEPGARGSYSGAMAKKFERKYP